MDRVTRDSVGKVGEVMDVFGGPVSDRLRSMFRGTTGGIAKGFAMGGVPGAIAGGGAGMAQDMLALGRFNPQAAATYDQSWELFKARIGHTSGSDHALNYYSGWLQRASTGAESGKPRGFVGSTFGAAEEHAKEMPWWMPPGVPFAMGLGETIGYKISGKEPPVKAPKPDLEAPPLIPGVGAAIGGPSSYEQYAMGFGMSTLNTSPLEMEKMMIAMSAMTNLLTEIRDSAAELRKLTPSFRG